jgi:hypothetical protein
MLVALGTVSFLVASCASSPPPCNGPQTKNLNAAMLDVQESLAGGCAAHFDSYYEDLLGIA